MSDVPLLVGAGISYLLGGIPFAFLVVWALKGIDVRQVGSGNVGATNASRAFGGRARLPVFAAIYVLDFAKGFAPAWWGPQFLAEPGSSAVIFGAAAIVGHCATPYLGFRGGKGVATATGVVAAIEPWALLFGLLAFFAVLAVGRRVFFGSLALGITLALAIVLRDPATAFGARAAHSVFGLAVALLLLWTHRSNLRRFFAAEAT